MSLIYWAKEGNLEEVRKCIKQGADVNTNKGLHVYTALTWTVVRGHSEIAKLLLENGADMEFDTKSKGNPLILAARGGRFEIAKLLLENGAEIEAKDSNCTALMWAAVNGNPDIVNLLLENGAHIERKCINGGTALWFAAAWGHMGIVKMLKDEIERRKHLKMARYTFLRHTNFHLAQEIALRTN